MSRHVIRPKLGIHADADGMGTIEKTMPAAEEDAEAESVAEAAAESVALAEAAESVALAEAAESVALAETAESVALAMSEARMDMADMIIEVASGGVTVVVEDNRDDEADEALLDWLTRLAIASGAEAPMKVMAGPATIALLWRSTAPALSGCSSDVIQIATGPLIPCGTTHSPIGSGMEKGRPPTSIWQW
jgi:hypothetical protein